MKSFFKFLWWLAGIGILISCQEKRVKIKEFPTKWHHGKSPVIIFENVKSSDVKAISFKVDGVINGGARIGDTVILPGKMGLRLGSHDITFLFEFPDGSRQVIKEKFTLFAGNPPVKLSYELVAEYPHDMHAFTQGLEFDGDTLFESTGQYGQSSLRKVDFQSGRVLKNYSFDDKIFAEGLTVWHDSIIVLTWQNKKGFIFDRNFNRVGEFPYEKSKEGWGLCHDEKVIYKSDGTEKIWILDPVTLKETDYFNVYAYKNKIKRINELEWVEGKIFTNIWMKNALAVINPRSGEVEAVLDLAELLKNIKKHPDLDVLNGIAYHKKRGTLFVTGKNWDKIFEIKILYPRKWK